jgi:Tol biopolymer transport system component
VSSVSADGTYVAFESVASNLVGGDANNACDVFVHNLGTGITSLVSRSGQGAQGAAASNLPMSDGRYISADGRYVCFVSAAANLVAGDTNVTTDVFVHDCHSGATEMVSVSDTGGQGNGLSGACSMSSNGQYVAFGSLASNLIAYGDPNGVSDVFMRARW